MEKNQKSYSVCGLGYSLYNVQWEEMQKSYTVCGLNFQYRQSFCLLVVFKKHLTALLWYLNVLLEYIHLFLQFSAPLK